MSWMEREDANEEKIENGETSIRKKNGENC